MIPAASSPISSSASERIIPLDSTPRRRTLPSSRPPGRTAPGSATATVCPPATFEAPQTIVRSPSPASTVQTRRRSAFGCGSAARTRPTTKPSGEGTPNRETRSTSTARVDRSSATASAGSPGSQYSQSQEKGTFIEASLRTADWGLGTSRELLQEPDVVFEEEPEVGDRVLQHRDPLDPHTEREPLGLDRVVAAVGDEAEDVGIDHAGAEDLDPPCSLADRVPLAVGEDAGAAAGEAGGVDLDGRPGEGEEV